MTGLRTAETARTVSELAADIANGRLAPRQSDPRLTRLLAEMKALAAILPCTATVTDSADEDYFDNMPV